MESIENKNFRIKITDPLVASQIAELEFYQDGNDQNYIYAKNKITGNKFVGKRNTKGIYHLMFENDLLFPEYIVVDLEQEDSISQIVISN